MGDRRGEFEAEGKCLSNNNTSAPGRQKNK